MVFAIHIVSAEVELYSGTANRVIAMGEMGELGIYPGHSPLLTRLKPGQLRLSKPDTEEEELFYISGGILEVQPHVITVLADTAIRASEIDEAAALEAKERAERELREHADQVDYARASAELAEAMAQLHALSKFKKKAGIK